MSWYKLLFPKQYFWTNYKVLHIQKVKVKKFAVVSLVLYIYIFSPFWLSFFYLLHFQGEPFITLEKAIKDNLKLQQWFLTKKLLWIFLTSTTQKTDRHREILWMNVSKMMYGIVLVLLWLWVIGKTEKKHLVFTITHIFLVC